MPIPLELRLIIRQRDRYQCAYCLTTEQNCGLRMHIDHILPEVLDGQTTVENLCLACFSCNTHKGAKQVGVDVLTGDAVMLFNPVVQRWSEHFRWDESKTFIVGQTPCGRATIDVLQMNNPTIVQARRRWVSAGWHPPENESVDS
jgi:hypothetical protein